MTLQNKRLTGIVLSVVLLLLVPVVAMQFSDEVNWTLSDFIAAAVLLLGTGLLCEFVLRTITQVRYRVAICAVLLLTLLLVWAELAIGIFGTPFAGS
jgi:integral membrane sensor domain MASE1